MKKQIKITVLFGAMLLTALSCGKKDYVQAVESSSIEATHNIQGLSYDGRMLIFATTEDYESAISTDNGGTLLGAIKNLNFESYYARTIAKNGSNYQEEIDETLGILLNKDGVIQIGQYLYKIDLQKDSVFAIEASYKENFYHDLIVGNTNNKRIVGFSTDEEVLYEVENRMHINSGGEKKRKWFCKEDGAGRRENTSPYIYFPNGGWANAGAKYAKYGVYFKLFFGTTSNLPTNRYRVYLQFENLWYKLRCETQPMGPMSHLWWKNHNANDQITYVSYSGTRQLNGFHVKARVRIEDWWQPSGSLSYTTYFSDWAKINVNSPYN